MFEENGTTPSIAELEAVGSVPTIEQAESMTKPGGTTLVFGVPPQDATIELSPFGLFFEECAIVDAFSLTRHSFERAVRLLRAGRIDFDSLVTHHIGLGELPDAFERMANANGLTNLVRPNQR
ncbi:hypothetical protein [Haladaptatus sp. NG-SE-30]